MIVIFNWFVLLCNIITKYKIQNTSFYNFDEIGFTISIIIFLMVIMCSNKYKKIKFVQFSNWKWITIIECINVLDWYILSFIIIKNIYYFFNWITDLDFLNDWMIKFILNKWTNNEIDLN